MNMFLFLIIEIIIKKYLNIKKLETLENQEFPEYIGIVPIVQEREDLPNVETLNCLYDIYCKKTQRNVEGFIIAQNNNVNKYVRMKNGKLETHHE